MELRVLQYFLAVAREQSILLAAKSLHLSQPTLSTQIKKLEEELGRPLLIRSGKGSRRITLTEEGIILKKRAEEILDLVKKTESEISFSDSHVAGDIYIGAGETDALRTVARAAKTMQLLYPDVRYHISSGNAPFVLERLDKGLLDLGVVFGKIDRTKYHALKIPAKDTWGVLMPRSSSMSKKAFICPHDLRDKPLILSQQEYYGEALTQWLGKPAEELNVVSTYNLVYNASLMVEEGLGYAICLDKILRTDAGHTLCFRPLKPCLETELNIIWKKYQVFSKPAEIFLSILKESLLLE